MSKIEVLIEEEKLRARLQAFIKKNKSNKTIK